MIEGKDSVKWGFNCDCFNPQVGLVPDQPLLFTLIRLNIR